MATKTNTTTKSSSHRKQLILLSMLVIITLVAGGYYLYRQSLPSKGSGSLQNPENASPKSGATPNKNGVSTGNTALVTPTGQVLNTNKVSLSADSGELYPGMESIVANGSPGAEVTIVASKDNGADKVVATGQTLGNNGQSSKPIDWNAKEAGLTTGSWNIRIKTTLNGQAAYSAPSILEVQP